MPPLYSMQRPVSKVVIAGPKQAGKKSLLRGLFKIDGHTRPSDLELSSPVSWELRTRYYRAPLSVIFLSHEQFAEPGPAAREAFDGAEALIIVLTRRLPPRSVQPFLLRRRLLPSLLD